MKTKKLYIAILAFSICALVISSAGCGKDKQACKTARDCVANGEKYLAKDKLEEAIKELKMALILDPNNFTASYDLGVAYYKAKDFKSAKDFLGAALKLDGKDAKTHNMMGLVLEKEGAFENAKKSFQQALQLDKNFEAARTNILNIDEAKWEYAFHRLAADFIYVLSKEYSNGNNSFMRGIRDTKPVKNELNNITRYDVSSEIYLAKEYFDKCSRLLEDAADKSSAKPPLDIFDTLSMAIQQRQEAIDLQSQGYSSGGSYSGEFEKAEAKVKIADSYYVDAAKKLENKMRDRPSIFSEKDFTELRALIDYYSRDKKSKIEIPE